MLSGLLIWGMMTETSITVSPTEGAPHVKSDPGQGQGALSWVRFNLDYFKTLPGILKLVEIVSKGRKKERSKCRKSKAEEALNRL